MLQRVFQASSTSMETCVIQPIPLSTVQPRQLDGLAFEVYDRLPRLVKRVETQGRPMNDRPAFLQYPYFTLAADHPPKPALTLAWPLRSYDVLNKWRLVHGAYGYDASLEMLVAIVIDSEGEGWEIRTWRGTNIIDLPNKIEELWEFYSEFADVAAIEWRLTVSRLGIMTSDEHEGRCIRWPLSFISVSKADRSQDGFAYLR